MTELMVEARPEGFPPIQICFCWRAWFRNLSRSFHLDAQNYSEYKRTAIAHLICFTLEFIII